MKNENTCNLYLEMTSIQRAFTIRFLEFKIRPPNITKMSFNRTIHFLNKL